MHKKHLLTMLACCLIPLAGVAALWLFKLPANNGVYLGLMLLCPVLHFVMMRDMTKPGQSDQGGHSHAPVASQLVPVPVEETRRQPLQSTPKDKS